MIDNLMTTIFDDKEGDYYIKQGSFIGKIKQFARNLNVHIHIIAHPRKSEKGIKKEDISGTREIINRSDNIFLIERVDEKDHNAIIEIMKNRFLGRMGKSIKLKFNSISKRFYLPEDNENRRYGWIKI